MSQCVWVAVVFTTPTTLTNPSLSTSAKKNGPLLSYWVHKAFRTVSFYRVPKVIHNKGSRLAQLSRRCREGFIAVLPHADLSERVIDNNRVCSRHFLSGRPAEIEDDLNPDWLPTQHLGHDNIDPEHTQAIERYERSLARVACSERFEAAVSLLSISETTPSAELDGTACLPTRTDSKLFRVVKQISR